MSPFASRTSRDYDCLNPGPHTVQEEPASPEEQAMQTAVPHAFKITPEWLLAGDAIFTISCPADWADRLGAKERYTFRVQRVDPKEGSRYVTPAWFVKLLTGPENTSDYSYLGKLDDFSGQVRTTAKSCAAADSTVVKLLNRVLLRAWGGDHAAYEARGFSVTHAGRCARCGRLLTVPGSVESGFGPECIKLVGKGR